MATWSEISGAEICRLGPQAKGYESGEWATYQQWQDRGAQVRKGEKSTLIVFWKFANDSRESQDDCDQPANGSRLLFTRGYSVFNAVQVDGYAPKAERELPIPERIAPFATAAAAPVTPISPMPFLR